MLRTQTPEGEQKLLLLCTTQCRLMSIWCSDFLLQKFFFTSKVTWLMRSHAQLIWARFFSSKKKWLNSLTSNNFIHLLPDSLTRCTFWKQRICVIYFFSWNPSLEHMFMYCMLDEPSLTVPFNFLSLNWRGKYKTWRHMFHRVL